ncbi:MAG: hypothetical protein IKF36_03875 [Bacilli bacterium]|nr:hypothetical protein [Bacilli bacterium]
MNNKLKIGGIVLIGILILTFYVIYMLGSYGPDSVGYNKKEMEEDQISIEDNGTIIYAKKKDTGTGGMETYIGDGYTIIVLHGGDIINYSIYVKDEKVWTYDKTYPLTN